MTNDYQDSNEQGREGYGSSNEPGESRQHFNNSGNGRARFTRGARPANAGSYGSRYEGGYQPRNNGGSYQPQNHNNGYQPRGGYQNRDGYQNREGYQSREGGEGGYRPRYNPQGGYQPRENRWGKSRYGQDDQQQGFRPRYNQQGGYNRQQGGYDREGGYRQNGYQQGGYRPNSYGNRPQQQGFRPRYNQQGGAYGNRPQQRRDGYDPHAKYSHKKRMEYKEENFDPTLPLRLNKFLANAGVCSRRDADKYIEAGVVTVNGNVVTELGTKVLRTDEIKFHDTPVKIEKKVYVLLNKPKGYVTTSEDPQNRKTVMDLVRGACPERIYPVGRLDRTTTGVLLLTNDGDMASKLTHPKFLKKKIYHVVTDKNVSADDMRQIAEGIQLEDGEIKADAIEYASETDKKQIGIEIHSGKNRIVRRIFESLGYHVTKLDRVYFAGLTKKNVRRGDWRYLTEKEVQMLRMGAFE